MQRQLKFRCWDGYKMQYGWGCYTDTNDKSWLVGEEGHICSGKVMQYCGLHDQNGKEIWEGDLVKLDNEKIGKIVFERGYFGFMEYAGKEYNNCWNVDGDTLFVTHPITPLKLHNKLSEVIGNIYENPELLTKENK